MDLFEELDVSDSLLVVGDDVLILDTCEGVAVLEVAVGVLSESFIASHPYSGEVMSVTRSVVSLLVVGREEAGQCCPGGDALCWEITRGKYPAMWSSLPLEARAAMLYILSHILGSERPSYFSMAGLKSLGYLIVPIHCENVVKLLTAHGLADGA
jgi:hypothetical protein